MFLKEFKMSRKSLLIWVVSLIVFLFLGMQKYTAFTGAGTEEMMKIFDQMPYVLKAMFGMAALDITTIVGYFGALYFYLVLIFAIHSLLLGLNLIYSDEVSKTYEFLYTKPISRRKILFNKILVGLSNLVILNLVTYFLALFIIKGFSGDYLFLEILISSFACLLIQILFLGIGILLGVINNKRKKAFYIGILFIFVFLFLSVAIDVFSQISFLNILTPFKYADPKLFLISKTLDFNYIVWQFILIIIIFLISFIKFDSRDLGL